jgi:hypothetical protein
MIFPLVIAALLAALLIVAAWPWVDPILIRRDAYTRLLDRLEEEWEREDEPARTDWTNW